MKLESGITYGIRIRKGVNREGLYHQLVDMINEYNSHTRWKIDLSGVCGIALGRVLWDECQAIIIHTYRSEVPQVQWVEYDDWHSIHRYHKNIKHIKLYGIIGTRKTIKKLKWN